MNWCVLYCFIVVTSICQCKMNPRIIWFCVVCFGYFNFTCNRYTSCFFGWISCLMSDKHDILVFNKPDTHKGYIKIMNPIVFKLISTGSIYAVTYGDPAPGVSDARRRWSASWFAKLDNIVQTNSSCLFSLIYTSWFINNWFTAFASWLSMT